MYTQKFSIVEIIILLAFLFVALIPFRLINIKNKLTFVNPLIIHNIFFLYYCFFSPIIKIFTEDIILLRGLSVVDSLTIGWIGSLTSVTFLLIGYFIPQRRKNYSIEKKCSLNYNQIWNYGFLINIIGFLLYSIFSGFDFNIFNVFSPERNEIDFLAYRGDFFNYFNYSINFLITGTLLTTIASLKLKKKVILSFFIFVLTTLIYLKFGFRYRLLFLIMPILLYYFLNFKVKRIIFFAAIPVGVFFANIFELIRTYGSGLKLDRITEYNLDMFLEKGFSGAESDVFIFSAGIMSIIPEKLNYIYFTPILQTILYPIPRVFIEKSSGDYVRKALEMLFSNPNIGTGAAFLNFVEYYYMFGWVGIIIFSGILGFIFKKLWIWINIHQEEPLALPLYLLNISYIYMIISRGYMPQQVLLYFFSIMPINLVYYFNSEKIIQKKVDSI